MKKKKRFLACMLAAVLAAGNTAVLPVNAEEVNLLTAAEDTGIDGTLQETELSYLQDTVIEPFFLETSESGSEYTKTPMDIPAGSEDVTLVYPVIVPEAGAVTIGVVQNDTVAFSGLSMELYSDVGCTEKYGSLSYFGEEEGALEKIFCPQGGTYYLKVVFNRNDEITDAKSFTVISYFISNEDRKLAEDIMAFTYSDDQNKDVWYQVKADKAGVLVFTAAPTDGTSLMTGDITLYNADKKALSAKEYVSNSGNETEYIKSYYTVKKGTYYIKFSSCSSTGFYLAGYSVVSVKSAAGASVKTAENLKFGAKPKQGMMFVSDSMKKADWYQVKLNKDSKFTIIVNAYVSGKVKMEVCNSKGKTVLFGTRNLTTGQYTLPTKGKWSKGTYYIKMTKYNKKSSGYYELKIKK